MRESDFADTEPHAHHQRRLARQWGWRRWQPPVDHDGRLGLAHRWLLVLGFAVWTVWSCIGLLSGHMYVLIGLPVHFFGVPALLVASAVLVGACACAVTVVRHHADVFHAERYRAWKWTLWKLAGALGGVAIAVALLQHGGLLPPSDGRVGLLSVDRLRKIATTPAMATWFDRRVPAFEDWAVKTMVVFMVLMGVAYFLSGGRRDAEMPRPVAFVLGVASLPMFASITLAVLANVAAEPLYRPDGTEEEMRSHMAWMHTLLLACIGLWLAIGGALCLGLLRWLGRLRD